MELVSTRYLSVAKVRRQRWRLLASRGWSSPTLNTLASFGARSLSVFLLLPILLRRFTPEELSVWYLLGTLLILQTAVEYAFCSTFVRVIAYAMKAGSRESAENGSIRDDRPDFVQLAKIVGTMRAFYNALTVGLAILLGFLGTLALRRPISQMGDPTEGWISSAIAIAGALTTFRFGFYSAWLQGANQIALVRRWETLTSLCGTASSFAVLSAGGGLLELVIAAQAWHIVSIGRNAWLSRRLFSNWIATHAPSRFSREVFQSVWPSAWRSLAGVALYQGAVQCSALAYAQTGESKDVASYLLALRLQQFLCQMAAAPLASRIPQLAGWWAEGRLDDMVRASRRAAALSAWGLVIPVVFLAYFGPIILGALGSQTPFPDRNLWWVLGLAGLAERYGAIHIQLYSSTNQIVWHIANGISGLIIAATALLFFPFIGIMALPLGMLFGNGLFYIPYGRKLSRAVFRFSLAQFELPTVAAPICFLILSYLGSLIFE